MSLLRTAELQAVNPVKFVLDLAKRNIPGKTADIIIETPVQAEPSLDIAA